MGALHFGLILYGILGALITLYFTSIKGGKIFSMELILFYIPILSIFLYLGINLFDQLVPFDFEDGLAAAVQTYQSGHNETRAMYSYKPEIEGLLGLIIFIPISLFQYLLEPMPWKIATGLDLALFFENIFRLILIIFALKNFFHSQKRFKNSSSLFNSYVFCIRDFMGARNSKLGICS